MKQLEPKPEREPQPDRLFAEADFTWKVTTTGYRWEELPWVRPHNPTGQEDKAWLLTDGIPVGKCYESRPTWPLKEVALFRKFADLVPTDKEQIRTFANQFGLLGVSVSVTLPLPGERQSGSEGTSGWVYLIDERSKPARRVGAMGFGEQLATWSDAIRSLKRAVQLHQLITRQDRKGLKKFISRRNDQWVYENRDDLRYGTVITAHGLPLPANDIVLAARICLQRWINDNLANHVAPRLLWDSDSQKHEFRVMPQNLLGALWIQLARVVVGEISYRPCKVCGKMLTISFEYDGFRADREFCGPTCRQRDHRRKVREARELRKSGKSVKSIASHFDTSTETIRRWLDKEK